MKAPITALTTAAQLYQRASVPDVTVESLLQIYPLAGDYLRSYSKLELNLIDKGCGVIRICKDKRIRTSPKSCIPVPVALNLDLGPGGCRNLPSMQNASFVSMMYLGIRDVSDCYLWDQPNCQGTSEYLLGGLASFRPFTVRSVQCSQGPVCCQRNSHTDQSSVYPFRYAQFQHSLALFSLPNYQGQCMVYDLKKPGQLAKLCWRGSVQVSGYIECSEFTTNRTDTQHIRTVYGSGFGLDDSSSNFMEVRCANNMNLDQGVYLQDPNAARLACHTEGPED